MSGVRYLDLPKPLGAQAEGLSAIATRLRTRLTGWVTQDGATQALAELAALRRQCAALELELRGVVALHKADNRRPASRQRREAVG